MQNFAKINDIYEKNMKFQVSNRCNFMQIDATLMNFIKNIYFKTWKIVKIWHFGQKNAFHMGQVKNWPPKNPVV